MSNPQLFPEQYGVQNVNLLANRIMNIAHSSTVQNGMQTIVRAINEWKKEQYAAICRAMRCSNHENH